MRASLQLRLAGAPIALAGTIGALEGIGTSTWLWAEVAAPSGSPCNPFGPTIQLAMITALIGYAGLAGLLVAAVGCGLGYAFVSDAISGAVRGARNVRVMLGVAPLAIIPYQMNMADVRRRKSIQKRSIIVGVVIIITVLILIHFLVSPLDVLWFRILRKIDTLTA